MAKRKGEALVQDLGPACSPTQEQQDAAVLKLARIYEDNLETMMARLHNQFVAFISESRLPLPQVLLVLQMLVAETVKQANRKFLGE